MIVTSGTVDRHGQKRAAGFVDLLIDDVHQQLFLVGFDDFDVAEDQESDRHQPGGPLFDRVERHEVAGNLFAHEPVVRLVTVERINDVIAIPPGMLREHRIRCADLIRVADEIEPVPRPAFPERP